MKTEEISKEIQEKIVSYLQGSCSSVNDAVNAFLDDVPELDEDNVIEIMTDAEQEVCDSCGWWFEICELDEDLNCEDCR